MEIAVKTEEALRILSVNGTRIDAAVAIEFKNAVRAKTEDGPDTVVLDLSHVEFIDSSGLGAIVAAMKHIGKDRSMALAGLTPAVERVFQLTRMDTVFNVFHTLDTALTELKPN